MNVAQRWYLMMAMSPQVDIVEKYLRIVVSCCPPDQDCILLLDKLLGFDPRSLAQTKTGSGRADTTTLQRPSPPRRSRSDGLRPDSMEANSTEAQPPLSTGRIAAVAIHSARAMASGADVQIVQPQV